jgi:hypothetical protein
MARPRKHEKGAKRESPVQFRLESDLGRLVHGFAQRHGLGANEAAKSLIALAVVTLDCRYYGLVRQMADAIGGAKPFVSACLRVNASLEGAAVATNQPFIPEDTRRGFILRVAQGVLAEQGKSVDTTGLDFLTGGTATAEPVATAEKTGGEGVPPTIRRFPKRRRSIKPVVEE